ncbi:GDSL-type esterase/lipase family protein [Secundilactobacillus similis]|uniref:SGNH hydrolase-type esterase domain-containing protein n=1 Tax=Secundilactobacillus similis DSM 23365 = JCM 2765 TaxID=1423804 RepID=A0A0R2F963_9LACO|nr:GDSL-type esterase/lipase family protein [Secundilactobacillus similis]KRN21708.1 hypothetical protein FD14_GL000889 [Secundilactobacillus similis DSM 23365 = JCM 2765]
MTENTKALTNLDPKITTFQNQLYAKYDLTNQTVTPGQTVFVGSSLMEIFPIERFQAEQELNLTQHIYNRGVRATTTADLLAHLTTQVLALKPSRLFINIGSNDLGFNVPEATFFANYTTILTRIHAELPDTQIFVMAFYPINAVADFGEDPHEHQQFFEFRSNDRIDAANQKVQQLVTGLPNVTFIDASDGLRDKIGNLRQELTFDGAHLLPDGYQIILNNLMPYLQ